MKYRILKRNGKYIPQIKRNIKWVDIFDECQNENIESTKCEKNGFPSEMATIDFIKQWHSENIETEMVVSEFEL